MAKKRIVMAIGHKDMGTNLPEQKEAVQRTAKVIADFIQEGWQVAIVHSNAPQVGMIQNAFAAAHDAIGTPEMPLPECGAMSQGYIGYHLQQGIGREMHKRYKRWHAATVVTQIECDPDDPAFKNPTKPIGSFFTEQEAELLTKQGYTLKEDAGRGYRRVVASPKPVDIIEKETVKALVDAGQVVITVGGGGIPVIREGNHLRGASAVIDKDWASARLAEMIDADMLIILTAVEKVAINFGKENEQWLDRLSLSDAERFIEEGHFAKGSMLPKVEAAASFARSRAGREALITVLSKAKEGIEGKTGTVICQ